MLHDFSVIAWLSEPRKLCSRRSETQIFIKMTFWCRALLFIEIWTPKIDLNLATYQRGTRQGLKIFSKFPRTIIHLQVLSKMPLKNLFELENDLFWAVQLEQLFELKRVFKLEQFLSSNVFKAQQVVFSTKDLTIGNLENATWRSCRWSWSKRCI